ncbi:hypothetical protein LV75_006976 [Actinokineospora diospyrosa]|uniref:Uncharacterized protein n=1 Tax=Actinokineospora diospyrosa TaxID=103728 RepID=A0ABT1IQL3_9PSEU|nr:hypothetical protein [Actinokineospora diospyrosa]
MLKTAGCRPAPCTCPSPPSQPRQPGPLDARKLPVPEAADAVPSIRVRPQPTQTQSLAPRTPPCQPASAHLLSTWTLGLGGAIPASSGPAPTHLANPWTLGPAGCQPGCRQVRPNPPDQPLDTRKIRCHLSPFSAALPAQRVDSRTRRCQPAPRQVRLSPLPSPAQSESLVPGARWGGPVLCGGTAPVAFPRGRASLWAPALRFCVGCRRGPAQNRSTPSSFYALSRIGRRGRRQATRPSTGAEGGGPKFLPRIPNHGLRQDQPDRKPPNTQRVIQSVRRSRAQ